jgi:hypothetical protein
VSASVPVDHHRLGVPQPDRSMKGRRGQRVSFSQLCALGFVSVLVGCSRERPPEPSASTAEFQSYYSGTKWYWSHVVGLPQSVPGYKAAEGPGGAQVHLISEDEQRVIRYTEMEPRNGMKTFQGLGRLERASGPETPLFRLVQTSNSFIGFFDHRAFRIDVVSWGPDSVKTLRDVSDLSRLVFRGGQK